MRARMHTKNNKKSTSQVIQVYRRCVIYKSLSFHRIQIGIPNDASHADLKDAVVFFRTLFMLTNFIHFSVNFQAFEYFLSSFLCLKFKPSSKGSEMVSTVAL